MNNPDNNFDLDQNRLGLGFISPKAEQAFCAWRNLQDLPAIRINATVSIPPWVLLPWIGQWWRNDIDWFLLWWPGHAFAVPMLVLAVISTYTRIHPFSTRIVALTLMTTGSSMLWIIAYRMQSVPGFETTGPAVAVTVFFACFALFMRMPPILGLLCISPFMLAASAMVVERFQEGTLGTLYVFAYLMILGAAYSFTGIISVVAERYVRKAFINEQIVIRQKGLLESQKTVLEDTRNLIRRYVPPAVANHIINGRASEVESPQRRRVTLLFADIMGFTEFADRVEPEVIAQVVGEYMAAMADIVDAHKGTVNEFVGDGLMAMFGAPQALSAEEQAINAVRAAIAMQARLPQLNIGWRKLGLGAPVKIRIGINTGMSSVGSYGSIGRMTYTAIGLQTNIAARIQSHCEPGGILMSQNTWELIRDEIDCKHEGEVSCKGVHFPVSVYSVMKN